jgi:diaminopimelate epimerase
MLKIPFVKYHGAGNDFIMIDDRTAGLEARMDGHWIARACHRHFGIGADGLILLQQGRDGADFFMRYYNSDGRTSSFCGNGGRCIVAFAAALGLHDGKCRFLGTDGWHSGEIMDGGHIELSMTEVTAINTIDEDTFILDTGSPHYVMFTSPLYDLDVRSEGRHIRNNPSFGIDGINVNFVERVGPGEISIRTYERGVEDETMACGTGVVASAIGAAYTSPQSVDRWTIHARGGDLKVYFDRAGPQHFTNVRLTGPAVEVFRGESTDLILFLGRVEPECKQAFHFPGCVMISLF